MYTDIHTHTHNGIDATAVRALVAVFVATVLPYYLVVRSKLGYRYTGMLCMLQLLLSPSRSVGRSIVEVVSCRCPLVPPLSYVVGDRRSGQNPGEPRRVRPRGGSTTTRIVVLLIHGWTNKGRYSSTARRGERVTAALIEHE